MYTILGSGGTSTALYIQHTFPGMLVHKKKSDGQKGSKLYKQVHLYMMSIGAKWGSIVYSNINIESTTCDTSIQRFVKRYYKG